MDLLLATTGSVDEFLERMTKGYGGAVRQDLQASVREGVRAQQRLDAMLFGLSQLSGEKEHERLRRLRENQALQEAEIYQTRLALAENKLQ